jgi:hypothetical protein
MNSFREWARQRESRTVLGLLVLAVLLCAWTARRALQHADVPAAPGSINIVAGALDLPARREAVDVDDAVQADLFAPDRKAPAAPYRMPGEAAPKVADEPPKPVVLGTAIAADGSSFATCQYQSDRLLMVRVGARIGDYTVKSIARGRVVFATPAGKTFEVLAPRAGS